MQSDSLYLDILTSDYEKKLTGEKPLTFFDKTIDYKKIDVYGLRDAYQSYLKTDDYNSYKKSDPGYIVFFIYGLFIFALGIFILVKVNRKREAVIA